jgi:hypothetical protein
MSLANVTENDVLEMILKGTDPSWRAGATGYLALVQDVGGAVSEAAPIAQECTYTGYARVPLTKASAWTDNGSSFANAALIQFGKRTDGGATQTATAFVIVDTASGAINMGVIGVLSAPLDISQNIQPQFTAGDLTVTAE